MKTISTIHIALLRHDPPQAIGVRAPADRRPVPGQSEDGNVTETSGHRP